MTKVWIYKDAEGNEWRLEQEQLRAALDRGDIPQDAKLTREGTEGWVAAHEAAELGPPSMRPPKPVGIPAPVVAAAKPLFPGKLPLPKISAKGGMTTPMDPPATPPVPQGPHGTKVIPEPFEKSPTAPAVAPVAPAPAPFRRGGGQTMIMGLPPLQAKPPSAAPPPPGAPAPPPAAHAPPPPAAKPATGPTTAPIPAPVTASPITRPSAGTPPPPVVAAPPHPVVAAPPHPVVAAPPPVVAAPPPPVVAAPPHPVVAAPPPPAPSPIVPVPAAIAAAPPPAPVRGGASPTAIGVPPPPIAGVAGAEGGSASEPPPPLAPLPPPRSLSEPPPPVQPLPPPKPPSMPPPAKVPSAPPGPMHTRPQAFVVPPAAPVPSSPFPFASATPAPPAASAPPPPASVPPPASLPPPEREMDLGEPEEAPRKPNKKAAMLVGLGLAGLVLVVVLGVGIRALVADKPSDKAPAPASTSAPAPTPSAPVASGEPTAVKPPPTPPPSVPETMKPCAVAKGPVRLAPTASKDVPLDLVGLPANGKIAVGYSSDGRTAQGMEVDPKTLGVKRAIVPPARGKLRRVLPMPTMQGAQWLVDADPPKGGGELSLVHTVPVDPPYVLGLAGGQLSRADKRGDATTNLFAVPGTPDVLRLLAVPGEGVLAAVRTNEGLFAAAVSSDRSARGALVKLSTEGQVGTPAMGTNGVDVAVVFAFKPSPEASWSLRLARAPKGSALATAEPLSLPAGGPGGDAFAPSIVGMADGRFLLGWTEGTQGSRVVRIATLSPTFGFVGAPIALSPATANAGQAVLAVAGSQALGVYLTAPPQKKGAYEAWGATLDCP